MIDPLLYGLTYLCLGAIAGLMAGILGLGGGMIVVPGLLFIFQANHLIPQHLTMHFATGTSLATMIFTSGAAVKTHYNNSHILWSVYKRIVYGLMIGACIGIIVAQFIPTDWLENVFGLFLLRVAYKLYKERDLEPKIRPSPPRIDNLVSVLVGFFSSLLGIGGGTMMIPYLTHTGISLRKAVPLSALSTMTIAAIGTLGVILIGSFKADMPEYALGYVYLPALAGIVLPSYFFTPLGVKLTYVMPLRHLKNLFIILVLLVALTMFM